MSRTYRHMSNWMIARYEETMAEGEPAWSRKPWSSRVHLRHGRRPQMHDGNFQRSKHTRTELEYHRRQRRHHARLALKKGNPDYVADLLGPWCRICGRPTPNNH